MTRHSVAGIGTTLTSFACGPTFAGEGDRAIGLIDGALHDLASAGRRAVRIVHLGCGSGATLIHAVRQARTLGFVAIDARGCDPSADAVAIARWATSDWHDPRIGLVFELGDVAESLAGEEERSVDLLLCSRQALKDLPARQRLRALHAVRRIGDRLVLTEHL